jgi:hypothetical protein
VSLGTALDEWEAHQAAQVQFETWGHLGPELGRAYPIEVLFCHGEYGDLTVIDLDSGELDGGPWLYEDVHDWLCDLETERGRIYRFAGTYRKGGRWPGFRGDLREVEVSR